MYVLVYRNIKNVFIFLMNQKSLNNMYKLRSKTYLAAACISREATHLAKCNQGSFKHCTTL